MNSKLAQLKDELRRAQRVKGNEYRCMIIQMAIMKEEMAVEPKKVHTESN